MERIIKGIMESFNLLFEYPQEFVNPGGSIFSDINSKNISRTKARQTHDCLLKQAGL